MSLDTMTIEEGINNVQLIVENFNKVDSAKIRFNSATASEIRKLRAAAICDYGKLKLMEGTDKDKEAQLQIDLQVQSAIIQVYEYLLDLHNTTTTDSKESNNV
jgi:hypothetical protein